MADVLLALETGSNTAKTVVTSAAFRFYAARSGTTCASAGCRRVARRTVGRGRIASAGSLLLEVEKILNPRRERGVRGDMGDEVCASVGATEEAGGLVVGPGGLLRRLERPQPHPYLLRGVLDLCHPSSRWSLPHTYKLAAAAALAPLLGSACWFTDRDLAWMPLRLEVDFHGCDGGLWSLALDEGEGREDEFQLLGRGGERRYIAGMIELMEGLSCPSCQFAVWTLWCSG